MKTKLIQVTFLIICLFTSKPVFTQLTVQEFKSPPKSVKIHAWWHWMNGNISKHGITKDLESMHEEGIVEATILNIGSITSLRMDIPEIKFDSPEWYDMFQFALKEASRLGITLGVHNCDGWSTSGGPWVTPEMSMKKFTWVKTEIEGGKRINLTLSLPPSNNGFYRDVAILAVPVREKMNSFQRAKPLITLNGEDAADVFYDGNPFTGIQLKKGDVVDIAFRNAFHAGQLSLYSYLDFSWGDMYSSGINTRISYSKDGKEYTEINEKRFIGVNKNLSGQFPQVSAKHFRIEIMKASPGYYAAELELLDEPEHASFDPEIDHLLEKTAGVKAVQGSDFNFNKTSSGMGIPVNSIQELSGNISDNGVLTWKAPNGSWRIIRFGYTTTGVTNGPATPDGTGLECDKMDPAALEVVFNGFAKKLIDRSGDYLGNTFKFLFIDSWECKFQNWTRNFPEEFKKRRTYNITPWIPVLCGEIVENTEKSEAFLHDFRKTISDLIDENYYRKFQELCHSNKLEMHAEIIYGGSGPYPPLDILKSNRYPDMPMTEFWANTDANQFPHYQPVSTPTAGFPMYAALADGKQVIGSEAYTGYAHYSESPYDLKHFGDLAYTSGVNQMILHSYVHQPLDLKPGVTLGQWAAHFNRNNPWWDFSSEWMNYQARVQYVLQKGEPVADIIYFVGDRLPEFINIDFLETIPFGYRAGPCNYDMLENEAGVINNFLTFQGNQKFHILALPDNTAIEFNTLRQIGELVKKGVIVYGPKPSELISLNDILNNSTEFQRVADAIWGKVPAKKTNHGYGKGRIIWGVPIAEVLKQMHIEPDVSIGEEFTDKIMYIHKILDDSDVYFVFNQLDETQQFEMTFRMSNKIPEIWDPQTGEVLSPAIYRMEGNATRIPVRFEAREAKIFIFKNEIPAEYILKVEKDGVQLFPADENANHVPELPSVSIGKDGYQYSTEVSGNYIFTTNKGESFSKSLVHTEILPIENFKGKIKFSPISDKRIKSVSISSLKSLTEFDDPSIKYFAGKAHYIIEFELEENVINSPGDIELNLGRLDATAEVKLNNQLLTYAWKPETRIPVSGILANKNRLDITVAVVCRNRFIGDLIEYGSVESLWTSSPIEKFLNKDMPLKESGLIGPLSLIKD